MASFIALHGLVKLDENKNDGLLHHWSIWIALRDVVLLILSVICVHIMYFLILMIIIIQTMCPFLKSAGVVVNEGGGMSLLIFSFVLTKYSWSIVMCKTFRQHHFCIICNECNCNNDC